MRTIILKTEYNTISRELLNEQLKLKLKLFSSKVNKN